MTPWRAGAMPATAMAAAHAALGEPELVAARKRADAERRADLMRLLDAHDARARAGAVVDLTVDVATRTGSVLTPFGRAEGHHDASRLAGTTSRE